MRASSAPARCVRIRRIARPVGAAAPGAGRQIAVDRRGAAFGHQRHAAPLGHQLRDLGGGVAQIAEMARRGGAGAHAGGDAVGLVHGRVVDAVGAQRAFLHDAAGVVEFAGAVGAGPGAQAAADAQILVHQHDAVRRPLVGGAGGADGNAGRIVAMQAGAGEMEREARAAVVDLEAVDAVQPGPRRFGAVGRGVGQRRGRPHRVPRLAGDGAGMAADADIEVDDQAQFLL